MYQGRRIVAVTPAGRKQYLQILLPYILLARHRIDEWRLWCNTVNPDDIAYMEELVDKYSFIRMERLSGVCYGIRSIHQFFERCIAKDTTYVRFDDDICWVDDNALGNLLAFRIRHPAYFLVFANTINNSICSYIHQHLGCIPTHEGICEYDVTGAIAWETPEFAALAHAAFLTKLVEGTTTDYYFSRWVATNFERISVNCICWNGEDFAQFGGQVGVEEERWLSVEQPLKLGRPNAICGTALVAHFAYKPQRAWLEGNTDLLDRYEQLSRQVGQGSGTPIARSESPRLSVIAT